MTTPLTSTQLVLLGAVSPLHGALRETAGHIVLEKGKAIATDSVPLETIPDWIEVLKSAIVALRLRGVVVTKDEGGRMRDEWWEPVPGDLVEVGGYDTATGEAGL